MSIRNQKGQVLVVVMSLAMLLLIAGSVILQLVLNQAQTSKHVRDRIKAYALCEAGVSYAMWKLRTDNEGASWTWLTPYAGDFTKEAVLEVKYEDWNELGDVKKRVEITFIRDIVNPEDKRIRVKVEY